MRQLRAAIWRCSRQLRAELIGIESKDDSASPGEEASEMVSVRPYPVALFMHSGISLLVYLFSLMALGVPVALVSIRLSPVSIQHLLTVMKAQAVVASPLLISKVERAFGTSSFVYGMGATKVLAAAGFENFLPPQGNDDAIPVDIDIGEPGHYVSESDRNVLILHTSGTTGLPSLVYQSHKMLLGYASCHRRTGTEDVQGLNLSMLPLYHVGSLVIANHPEPGAR
jgi:acyl-CoA synthetase (AMP-forming)/AMP-acid ligase II